MIFSDYLSLPGSTEPDTISVTSGTHEPSECNWKSAMCVFGDWFHFESSCKPYIDVKSLTESLCMVFLPIFNELHGLEQLCWRKVCLLDGQHHITCHKRWSCASFGCPGLRYNLSFSHDSDLWTAWYFVDEQRTSAFVFRINRIFKWTMIEANIFGAL
jgi:hypothetical protein